MNTVAISFVSFLVTLNTENIVRNTKDGICTITGGIVVKSGDKTATMEASAIPAYLESLGLAPDALNDQQQKFSDYCTNLRTNLVYEIQVLSPSRWRILKKVKLNKV
jgi:hypothetical protein